MQNNHTDDISMRMEFARIIFFRLSEQISGERITEMAWHKMVTGWVENPALFPLVEACVDAAEEILNYLRQHSSDKTI